MMDRAVKGGPARERRASKRTPAAATALHRGRQPWRAPADAVQYLVEGIDRASRRSGECVDPGYGDIVAAAAVLPSSAAAARGSTEVAQAAQRGTSGPGGPLPHMAEIQRSFGKHDVSGVVAHGDPAAARAARTMGAQAFATGEHVAFAGPASLRIAAHEAAHVVQQRAGVSLTGGLGRAGDIHERHADEVADRVAAGRPADDLLDRYAASGGAAPPVVQLAIDVDDVVAEMVGVPFTLRNAQGEVPAGATVVVKSWNGTAPTATVTASIKGKTQELVVPKLALDPVDTAVTGVRRYDVGVPGQQAAVEKSLRQTAAAQQAVTDLRAKEGQFKKHHAAWQKDLAAVEEEFQNQEQLLAGRQTTLSRILVKQTMFNRFDAMIAKWVKHYNDTLHPKTPCDPNVVKSMLFRETRLGTSGKELNPPPYHDWSDLNIPFHSRFNVMMNIKSSGEQQMLMLRELAPAIFAKHHLDEFEKKQRPKEWNDTVIWGNPEFRAAVREMFEARADHKNLMDSHDVDLQEDYEFWIRTGIRWLFFKYFAEHQSSWNDAVRAYNGRGGPAEAYKKDVMSRTGSGKPLAIGDR